MANAATPVVLLHGCSGSVRAAFEMPGWIEAFTRTGRAVVAPDLPGHGWRTVSHDPADYADLAGEVASQLPPGSFDAVGFSLGAKLVLELALRDPARWRRLVLGAVGDNVFAPEVVAPIAAEALESPQSAAANHPAVRVMLQHWDPSLNDARAVAAVLRRPPNPVFTPERLRALAVPVLVVNGGQDPVGQQAQQLHASLRNAQFLTLCGVDHFGLPAHPDFLRAALAFLDREVVE